MDLVCPAHPRHARAGHALPGGLVLAHSDFQCRNLAQKRCHLHVLIERLETGRARSVIVVRAGAGAASAAADDLGYGRTIVSDKAVLILLVNLV